MYGEHAAINCREDGEARQRKAGRRMEKTSSGNLFTFFNLWALQRSISMNGKVEFSFLGMAKSHESILKMQTMNWKLQNFCMHVNYKKGIKFLHQRYLKRIILLIKNLWITLDWVCQIETKEKIQTSGKNESLFKTW